MKEYKVLKVIIIILLALTLCLSGYIIYDKILSNRDSIKETNKVYNDGDGVYYYNPIENKQCDKNTNNCYGWYILTYDDNSNESQIELIMNQNLGDTVAYNENGSFEKPVTALNYLNKLTSNWIVKPRMISIYDVAGVLNTELNEDGNIGVQEIPEWLYSNGDEIITCDDDIGCGEGGYWISDSYFLIDATRGLISAGNTFLKSDPTNSGTWGVRPIIKINKSILN